MASALLPFWKGHSHLTWGHLCETRPLQKCGLMTGCVRLLPDWKYHPASSKMPDHTERDLWPGLPTRSVWFVLHMQAPRQECAWSRPSRVHEAGGEEWWGVGPKRELSSGGRSCGLISGDPLDLCSVLGGNSGLT